MRMSDDVERGRGITRLQAEPGSQWWGGLWRGDRDHRLNQVEVNKSITKYFKGYILIISYISDH